MHTVLKSDLNHNKGTTYANGEKQNHRNEAAAESKEANSSSLRVEHLIVRFLEEVPFPPRGKVRIKFSLAQSIKMTGKFPSITIERPPLNRLPLCNFSFAPLLTSLSVEQIVAVVTGLLMDQKVIVLSDDISKVPVVCESFATLLFPFRWQNPYIPLLPRSMCDMVYAPMGYLMGMPIDFYDPDDPMLAGECIIVDLDEKCVLMAETSSCQLPRRARSMLVRDAVSLRRS